MREVLEEDTTILPESIESNFLLQLLILQEVEGTEEATNYEEDIHTENSSPQEEKMGLHDGN